MLLLSLGLSALGLLVGIDLGTTNSAIAILRDGVPIVLPNRHGEPLTPSTVAFLAGGSVVVGQEANAQARSNVPNTVVAAKRFMGRSPDQCLIETRRAQVEVVPTADGTGVAFRLPALRGVGDLTPEEVAAHVLAELLSALDVSAEEDASPAARVCRAVVTVPAYFSARQRQATFAAAQLAGLRSVTLLAEPVAASLAYGLGGAVGKVLVFDLGAGTFDVSVLKLSADRSIEVLATSGDTRLGGTDFDAAILEHVLEMAKALGHTRLRGDASAMRVLRDRIEAAKIKLSVLTRVELQLPVTVAAGDATRDRNGSGDGDGSGGGDAMGGDAARGGGAAGLGDSPAPGGGGDGDEGDAVIVLTRSAVEGACEALLQRLKAPLYEVALAAKVALPGEEKAAAPRRKPKLKARLAAETQLPKGKKVYLPQGEPIAEIVMVGGAAQMAAVRMLVTNLFGVAPRRTVPPMEAVALGAAVYAGMLHGALPGRVMQSWQAKLGRLMEAAETGGGSEDGAGWEWSDGEEGDDDFEEEPPFAFETNE